MSLSDCPLALTLDPLPNDVVCYIPDFCTGVHCCVNTGVLNRNIHVVFELNGCDHRLVVGIENFRRNISLVNYSWGM